MRSNSMQAGRRSSQISGVHYRSLPRVAPSVSSSSLVKGQPDVPSSAFCDPASPSLHPTLELIQSRIRDSSKPGARKDGFKLGLVVEGGGMQGIMSGAMCLRINELGFQNVFDCVYGASAGAINGAYFVSNQNVGLDVYTDHCCDRSFLDLGKLVPKRLRMLNASMSSSDSDDELYASTSSTSSMDDRPAMNLEWLFGHVMESQIPLDYEAVVNSSIPLKIVASSLDSLRPVLLDSFADRDDLRTCLVASATVPEVAGSFRMVRGQRLVDAAVFEPVPIRSAISDGCTHCLVLCTRLPAKHPSRRARLSKMAKRVMEVVVKSTVMNAGYMKDAWRSELSKVGYIHDDLLWRALSSCPKEYQRTQGSYVMPLYPESMCGVSAVCTDRDKLLAARQEGCDTLDRLVARPLGLLP